MSRMKGFAVLDKDRVREIARMGGRAAHAKGTAHEWTSDEARVAGQLGGQARKETIKRFKELVSENG